MAFFFVFYKRHRLARRFIKLLYSVRIIMFILTSKEYPIAILFIQASYVHELFANLTFSKCLEKNCGIVAQAFEVKGKTLKI